MATVRYTGNPGSDIDIMYPDASGTMVVVDGTPASGQTLQWDGSKWIGYAIPEVAGPTGPQGADGAVGPQGADGAAGADGAQGATGPTGPSNLQTAYEGGSSITTNNTIGVFQVSGDQNISISTTSPSDDSIFIASATGGINIATPDSPFVGGAPGQVTVQAGSKVFVTSDEVVEIRANAVPTSQGYIHLIAANAGGSGRIHLETDNNRADSIYLDATYGVTIKGNPVSFENGSFRLLNSSNYVGFSAPTLSTSTNWVLPPTDGAVGQVLTTDGTGNLSWSAGGAGAQGPTGPQGTEGPIGATGAQGDAGPIGPQGDVGPIGPQGDVGAIGPQGDIGAIGPQGDSGPIGPQGDIGPQGFQGDAGPQGDTGPIGPQGDAGPQGTSFTWLDAWSDTTSYDINQVVSYNGSSYIALTTNVNVPPSSGPGVWSLLAAQGAQGPQGESGPQGDTGAAGPQGAEGAQGTAGAQGPQGADGFPGPEGPQGTAGPGFYDLISGIETTGVNASVYATYVGPYSATESDFCVAPGGTQGSFLVAVPDGTATGGNKRGTKAVDLQLSRAAATQVASGANSVISGGLNNTASGARSAVAGGSNLTLSGADSFGYLGNQATTKAMSISVPNTAVLANVNLWLANNDNTARELRLYEPNNTTGAFPAAGVNYTGFKAPVMSVDLIYTLPATDGNQDQALLTDGGGSLSWGTPTLYKQQYPWNSVQTLVAATALAPTGSLHRIQSTTTDITLTATPTINWASASAGTTLTILNVGTFAITFSQGSSYKLQLAAASRALQSGGSLTLLFDGTNWIELSFVASTSL